MRVIRLTLSSFRLARARPVEDFYSSLRTNCLPSRIAHVAST